MSAAPRPVRRPPRSRSAERVAGPGLPLHRAPCPHGPTARRRRARSAPRWRAGSSWSRAGRRSAGRVRPCASSSAAHELDQRRVGVAAGGVEAHQAGEHLGGGLRQWAWPRHSIRDAGLRQHERSPSAAPGAAGRRRRARATLELTRGATAASQRAPGGSIHMPSERRPHPPAGRPDRRRACCRPGSLVRLARSRHPLRLADGRRDLPHHARDRRRDGNAGTAARSPCGGSSAGARPRCRAALGDTPAGVRADGAVRGGPDPAPRRRAPPPVMRAGADRGRARRSPRLSDALWEVWLGWGLFVGVGTGMTAVVLGDGRRQPLVHRAARARVIGLLTASAATGQLDIPAAGGAAWSSMSAGAGPWRRPMLACGMAVRAHRGGRR